MRFHSIEDASLHRHECLASLGGIHEATVECLMMRHAPSAALFATFVVTAALSAQQAPPTDLPESVLAAYTRAHIELNSARDDYHRALAATHDLGEQARLRADLADRIAAVLSEHALSAEDYEHITTLISTEQPLRVRFEALLAALSDGGSLAERAPQ